MFHKNYRIRIRYSEIIDKANVQNIPIILQSKVKSHKVGKYFNDIFFEIVFRKNHFSHNKKSFCPSHKILNKCFPFFIALLLQLFFSLVFSAGNVGIINHAYVEKIMRKTLRQNPFKESFGLKYGNTAFPYRVK